MNGKSGDMSPKIRRSVSISKETMEWIQLQIKHKRFKDVSHAIEYAVYQVMTEKEK